MLTSSSNFIFSVGTLYGLLSATFVVIMWLATFHRKFCTSIWYTDKATPYGVYTTMGEALKTHYWFLLKQFLTNGNTSANREEWKLKVQKNFLTHLGVEDTDAKGRQVILSHSCRSIFYCIIKTILDQTKERTGNAHIKICCCTVQFGSFYRLLRGVEKSLNCCIEFVEVDLHSSDWTANWSTIQEEKVASCHLILAQHLFGVPFEQSKFWEWAAKYDIPLVEDCVQSGSLFGNYKGDPRSDVLLYSGGLDKTPSCFGAGFGHFRNRPHGNNLFQRCQALHESLPLDTGKARLIAVLNQSIHTMIAKNTCYFNNLLGLLAYVLVSERGDSIQWYKMSLKVRKAKAITPFQHAESGFLRQPCVAHYQSMMHGLSKDCYKSVAQEELRRRDVLLKNIPKQFHSQLFPWWTPTILKQHERMQGICEFSWVYAYTNDRMDLCSFLNDRHIVCLINTTWEYSAMNTVGQKINDSLVYLPNINELQSDGQIINLASILTDYCNQREHPDAKANSKVKSL